jgi:Transglutaminase-like superfamily
MDSTRRRPQKGRNLSARGLTCQQIADGLGIHLDTLIETRKEFSEFSERFQRGRAAVLAIAGSVIFDTMAWSLFGQTPFGWGRVQAICDFVHNHISFGYEHARATRTAWEAFNERRGVCRDFAHLAIAFCRCMNIPARYCTGYLGDIGVPPPYAAGRAIHSAVGIGMRARKDPAPPGSTGECSHLNGTAGSH